MTSVIPSKPKPQDLQEHTLATATKYLELIKLIAKANEEFLVMHETESSDEKNGFFTGYLKGGDIIKFLMNLQERIAIFEEEIDIYEQLPLEYFSCGKREEMTIIREETIIKRAETRKNALCSARKKKSAGAIWTSHDETILKLKKLAVTHDKKVREVFAKNKLEMENAPMQSEKDGELLDKLAKEEEKKQQKKNKDDDIKE